MADHGEAAEESRGVEDVLVGVPLESVVGLVADGDIVAPDAMLNRVPEQVTIKRVPELVRVLSLFLFRCLN